MTYNPRKNFSLIAQRVITENFCPQFGASLAVSGTSSSITFPVVTGQQSQTFLITNKGDNGAYLGWGHTSATAVVSSGTPVANCCYIASGAILTLDFQLDTGIVDTIAAIQDGGSTTLEISIGFGQ